MFNRLIKELIIDVNVPLRLAVRGMFVYCDIFNKLQTHLTGKLLNISILLDTLNELVYIFGILLFSIEPCCQLCLFLLQCFQFSLILAEQDTAGSLCDLSEVLILIHGLDQALQLRDTLLIGCEIFTAVRSFFCIALILDRKKSFPCSFFIINNQPCHQADIIDDQLFNAPFGDVV